MALSRVKIAKSGGPQDNMVAVGTSDTTVVENTNGTDKYLVSSLSIHNYHASSIIAVEVFLPSPSAGAVGSSASSNRYAYVTGLGPGETALIPFGEPGLLLTADGDAIVCKSDTASACLVTPFGDKIT